MWANRRPPSRRAQDWCSERVRRAPSTAAPASGNQIRIEGLESAIRKPTRRELDLFEQYLPGYDEAAVKRAAGIERFVDVDKREALRRLWFDCSLNIDGIWSGYAGPGSKTVLPPKANAKIDFRLVPEQRAAEVARPVRAHLDKHGFTDLRINWWNGYDPSQSDPDSALVRTALDLCATYGIESQVALRMAGSAPHYLFTRDLKRVSGDRRGAPGSRARVHGEGLRGPALPLRLILLSRDRK